MVIAADADDDLLEAGIAAVAALASRYPEGTEIELGALQTPPPRPARPRQRVVVPRSTAGRAR